MSSCPATCTSFDQPPCPHSTLDPSTLLPPLSQSIPSSSTLSTSRQTSSIPRTDSKTPWIYPSEAQFYNALKRKNWKASENEIKNIVPIHNAVNEKCWKEILEWESLRDAKESCPPRLSKFEGKPKELTMRARWKSWMGYELPFDRHDWQVERCGDSLSYVIDFYSGKGSNEGAVSFYLDVRPKLSLEGIQLRAKRFLKELFE